MPLVYVHRAKVPERKARTIQVVSTCAEVARLGIEVSLLVEQASEADLFSYYGIEPMSNLRVTAIGDLRLDKALKEAIASQDTNTAIFCRNLATASALLPLARRAATLLVYEAHKLAFMVVADEARIAGLRERSIRGKMSRTMSAESEVFHAAAGVVCTTDATARLARTFFGRARNVVVIRNGGPEPIEPPPEDWARDPQPQDELLPKRLVYVGNLGGWKGTNTLLSAMRLLNGFELHVAGAQPPKEDDRTQSERGTSSGEGTTVVTHGYLPPADIAPFLHSEPFAAGILSLPGAHSAEPAFFTSPLKLFQYLAAGIPVIASDVPALRELLRHRENAYMVEPDDPRALADAIKTVAFDRQLSLNLMKNGLETAKRFTWRKRAEALASFLKGLLPGI